MSNNNLNTYGGPKLEAAGNPSYQSPNNPFIQQNHTAPPISQDPYLPIVENWWALIQPFTKNPPPFFDLNMLPHEFTTYCYEAGKQLEVPPAQIFSVALSTFFCAIQGTLEVKVKKSFNVRVSSLIMISIVSGGKKTPVYNCCMSVLNEWISKNPDSKLAILDDMTPESFSQTLSEGPVGLMMDEGGRFEQLISDDKKNDILFKSLGGTPITIRRKTQPNIEIKRPVANALIMVQPERLQKIATKYNSKEYGVMARALLVGIEPIQMLQFDDFEMSEISETWYEETMFRLAELGKNISEESNEFREIEISPAAKELWKNTAMYYTAIAQKGGILEEYPEWASKAPSHLLSIAGLLHTIKNEDPLSQSISHETMHQAIFIMSFFINNMIYLYDIIGTKPDVQCANAILKEIKKDRMQIFPKVKLTSSMQGRYKAQEINQALCILQNRNYIFILSHLPTGKAGRPHSDVVHVNPSFWHLP